MNLDDIALKVVHELDSEGWAAVTGALGKEFARRLVAELAKQEPVMHIEKNAKRLEYCYSKQMEQLVHPIMTYEEWITAIDKIMEESK